MKIVVFLIANLVVLNLACNDKRIFGAPECYWPNFNDPPVVFTIVEANLYYRKLNDYRVRVPVGIISACKQTDFCHAELWDHPWVEPLNGTVNCTSTNDFPFYPRCRRLLDNNTRL